LKTITPHVIVLTGNNRHL